MQSRLDWASILKNLRQSGDTAILAAISNIPTIFTHDTVTIIAPNRGVYDMLCKNQSKLGSAVIRLKKSDAAPAQTVQEKLKNLLGEKLIIK